MSVYIQDSKVLVNSGSVATDSACCCNMGACCVGSDCSITTEADCTGMGGIYQGNGTNCDPNPCATGACCHGIVCDIETEAACTGSGGTYLGNGTPCLDLTCACPCGFDAFDGSGRKFLRYHRTISGHSDHEEQNSCDVPDDYNLSVVANCSATFEQHYASDCSLITDTDIVSSDHTVTFNGTVTDSCSRATVECFCGSIFPFRECGSFITGYVTCNVCDGGTTSCGTVVSGATMQTTTCTFSGSVDCECFACVGCTAHCDISGSYVVTETLSEECIPA